MLQPITISRRLDSKNIMKTSIQTLIVALTLLTGLTHLHAQTNVVTYQGRVTSSGINFNGSGQFKFALVTGTNISSTATATAVRSGSFVTSYNVTFGGSGYVTPPSVTVSGGGGSGATATANISGGVVTSITPVNAGTGYTGDPIVTISSPPENISYTTYWSNDGTSTAGSEPALALTVPVSDGLFTVRLGDTNLANMTALAAGLFQQPNLLLRIWFNNGVDGFAVLNPPPTADRRALCLGCAQRRQLVGIIARKPIERPVDGGTTC